MTIKSRRRTGGTDPRKIIWEEIPWSSGEGVLSRERAPVGDMMSTTLLGVLFAFAIVLLSASFLAFLLGGFRENWFASPQPPEVTVETSQSTVSPQPPSDGQPDPPLEQSTRIPERDQDDPVPTELF